MPVIRINVEGRALRLHRSPQPVSGVLNGTRNLGGPVIVMTHGFRYRPDTPGRCPHQCILSQPTDGPQDAPGNWLTGLGFGAGQADDGLAIALGWNAGGAIWQAHRRAIKAGHALADLIRELRRVNPDRPIHFIAHSMGVEPILEALHHLPQNTVNRIISLTGAAFRDRALNALRTPAGQTAEFINVTSGENDLFDFLYERLIAPSRSGDRSLGAGLQAPNALTLQLDCPRTVHHLARLGFRIGEADRRVSHWSAYLRPGTLAFYSGLLRDPRRLPLTVLRRGLPQHVSPRWSRLFALPRLTTPLPFAQKAS